MRNEDKKSKVQEGSASHSQSINQLSDQIQKFILKHKDNPNAVVNDFSIALFISFSEAFSKDGDPSTNGLNMLSKMIDKMKVLMKSYDDLIPGEGEDFDFDPEDEDDMQTTLDSDEPVEDEDDTDEEDEELDANDVEDDEEDEDDDVV